MNAPKYIVGQRVKMRTYQVLSSKLATIVACQPDDINFTYIISYDIGGEGSWPETSLGAEDEPDYPNIPFVTNSEQQTINIEQPPQPEQSSINIQEQQMTMTIEEEIVVPNKLKTLNY